MARRPSDIRARIQQAAREQFLSQGVDGASLRAIAAEAKTNIGMVYYYFPTKEDLFLAVVESFYAGLLADAAVALHDDAPVPERLRRLYARIWRMSADEFAVVRLVLREAMVSADRVRRLGARFSQGHIPLLFSLLQAGIDQGALRNDLPPIAMMVVTMVLGMMPMVAWRIAGERLIPGLPLPPPEEVSQLFAGILLNGIGARKPRPPAKRSRGKKRARPRINR